MLLSEFILFESFFKRRFAFNKLLLPGFHVQNKIIREQKRWSVYNATRRAAKTSTWVLRALHTLDQKREVKHVVNGFFAALTGESAKGIIWQPFLEGLERLGIPHRPNEQKGVIRYFKPNGELRVFGLDLSHRARKKAVGNKFCYAGIDECGVLNNFDLDKFIRKEVRSALSDYYGWLALLGTCEDVPETKFQAFCEGSDPAFHVYRWDTYDNPAMVKQWTDEVNDVKANYLLRYPNGDITKEPWFATQYMNVWMADFKRLIIQISSENKVTMSGIKEHCILGVDLGHDNASAFTLWTFDDNADCAYIYLSTKKEEMTYSDVVTKIKKYQREYPIREVTIDGADKQGCAEMARVYELSFTPADKSDKPTFLKIMKDGFLKKRLFVNEALCKPLLEEWKYLIWYRKADGTFPTRKKEDPKCANDCSDSGLYALRKIFLQIPTLLEKITDNKLSFDEQVNYDAKKYEESLRNRAMAGRERPESSKDFINFTKEQEDQWSYFQSLLD